MSTGDWVCPQCNTRHVGPCQVVTTFSTPSAGTAYYQVECPDCKRLQADLDAATDNANVLAIRLDIAERALLDVAERYVGMLTGSYEEGCRRIRCPLHDPSEPDGCSSPWNDAPCCKRIAEQAKEKVAKESDER